MFYDCSALETFNSNLPKITLHNDMFKLCSKLNTFRCESVGITTDAYNFLADSRGSLKLFYSDLPNLTDTKDMFINFEKLERF
jgi:hypothetical protein